MIHSIEFLRLQAKKLRQLVEAGDASALERVGKYVDTSGPALKHADFLHVIANEHGFGSWPKLKFATQQSTMDRAQKAERLERALYNGQTWVADMLLESMPELAHANIGIECALYDVDAVRKRLTADPDAALRAANGRTPILHLAFSKHFHGQDDTAPMIRVAELLKAHGANIDDTYAFPDDEASRLSALYGALGHADNMVLARWLLENGANPDDNESLYHATELGHLEGLRLMLEHGARIDGTNALARMLDFNDPEGVRLLLEAGADPNEGARAHPSGEPGYALCALHHAARRRCSGQIAQLLLDHGAEGRTLQFGHSAYALARMYGNADFARALERAGQATALGPNEAIIARAATQQVEEKVDAAALGDEQRRMLCRILAFDAPLAHLKRLVGVGLDPDAVEEMGMPAIHVAGWEGHADAVEFLLGLAPDLTLKNSYGGDLMGTILHGADNCPAASRREHARCAALVLEAGAPLHRYDIDHCAAPDLRDWLANWADEHPDRVV